MSSECRVEQVGEDFVLVNGDAPVRTPLGTPMVSRYHGLLLEAAEDVRAFGAKPTEQFSMFSLQASHLDFTLRRERDQLEAGVVRDSRTDLWFNRPAFPPVQLALDELWGPPGSDALRSLPERLRELSLRQLTATIVSRANLNSAQVALEALASASDLVPLARGACASFFEGMIARWTPDYLVDVRDGTAWRRPPSHGESPACRACRSGGELRDTETAACCEIQRHLQLLRRFAEFPEEPSQRSLELLEHLGRYLHKGRGRRPDEGNAPNGTCECEVHFDRGTEWAKAGDLGRAVAEYRASTELCCDNAQAWLYLGNCLFNIGKHDEALDALERAVTLRPDVALIWESKANVLNDLDRDEEAFDCYVRALELDPTRVRSRLELARVMIDQRRFKEALELADGALKVDPDNWYAHAKRALALHSLGRHDAAEASYRIAIEANPRSAQTINNYGTLLEERGDREGAASQYERALEADPGYGLAATNLQRLRRS